MYESAYIPSRRPDMSGQAPCEKILEELDRPIGDVTEETALKLQGLLLEVDPIVMCRLMREKMHDPRLTDDRAATLIHFAEDLAVPDNMELRRTFSHALLAVLDKISTRTTLDDATAALTASAALRSFAKFAPDEDAGKLLPYLRSGNPDLVASAMKAVTTIFSGTHAMSASNFPALTDTVYEIACAQARDSHFLSPPSLGEFVLSLRAMAALRDPRLNEVRELFAEESDGVHESYIAIRLQDLLSAADVESDT